MSTEDTGHRLAREVAQAADAWLTDPLDVGVYQHLVTATLRWRSYSQPMLEGTENAGRRKAPPPPAEDGGEDDGGEDDGGEDDEPGVPAGHLRAPLRIGASLRGGGDNPKVLLAHLAGRPVEAD